MRSTPLRVFTATLATETNTFAPLPTGLEAFRQRGYYPAGTHPEAMSFFAAPLWAARQRARECGWTLHEGLVAEG
jgi:microcystin degradation protein MlrC